MNAYPVAVRDVHADQDPGEMVVESDLLGKDEVLVYRFFGADGILYVGITCQPRSRWLAHRRLAPWWAQIASLETERCATRDDARDLEADIVYELRPVHNLVGNPDRRR